MSHSPKLRGRWQRLPLLAAMGKWLAPATPPPSPALPGHDVETVQRWMTLDLWAAFGGDPLAFDDYYDALGFASAWASLCAEARRKRTYA